MEGADGKGRRKRRRDKGEEEDRDAHERDLQSLVLWYLKKFPAWSPGTGMQGRAHSHWGS